MQLLGKSDPPSFLCCGPLEASAVVGQLANAIEDEVDDLLANRVVTAGEVVRRVLLTADELLRVEELT